MSCGTAAAAADRQYEVDYGYGKGCGICAAGCPCGTIEMVPEAEGS
jgi:Pyruvate/2-oxoacid:ferredoxin oxidoreductase delta subunit